ncbi:MAG: hypothetical protein IM571_09010 [Chitinophagaceae bacterium]|nr:hypothetical protein [Chitinophagaceae bacterium]
MSDKNQLTTDPFNREESPFSFTDLVQDVLGRLRWALQQRNWLLLALVMGALAGTGYAWMKNTTYTARLTFVVEDAKSSGGSLISALAGQFGLDVGGMTGGNGVLAGDNVLELLKSRSLLKKTLLTSADDGKMKMTLADRYVAVYGLQEKWNDVTGGKKIVFTPGTEDRLTDSLLQTIIKRLLEKELRIAKTDKKLGFFELEATTRDEYLSQQICERLLRVTTDFYVDTKTSRLKANIDRLQRRADSLGIVLDNKTYATAEATQRLLDANPAYASPQVDAEISTRNKYLQSTVFAEIVKNLEISKTALIQETPTVQVVDRPEMPLKKNEWKWWQGLLLGGVIALAAMVGLMIVVGGRNSSVENKNNTPLF